MSVMAMFRQQATHSSVLTADTRAKEMCPFGDNLPTLINSRFYFENRALSATAAAHGCTV
jgi:hypothetical protein